VVVTPDQYLELDREPGQRLSDYWAGELHAIPRATRQHKSILANLTKTLNTELALSRCKAMVGPVRVRIPGETRYLYADLLAICGGNCDFEDSVQDTVLNPKVLVEIQPPPAAANSDSDQKGGWYRSIPTLRSHILVAQDRVAVSVYTRPKGQDWSLEDWYDIGDVVEVSAINAKIPLAQLYNRIEFEESD
jgi:hypothetical protein